MNRFFRWLFRDYSEFYKNGNINDNVIRELKWDKQLYVKVKNIFITAYAFFWVFFYMVPLVGGTIRDGLNGKELIVNMALIIGVLLAIIDNYYFNISFCVAGLVLLYVSVWNMWQLIPIAILAVVCNLMIRNIKEIGVCMSMARIKEMKKAQAMNPNRIINCFDDSEV